MITVYSSALIFDPWNEIAECKDSPALLYLSRGRDAGWGEHIGAPAQTGQGGTRAQSPHAARHLGVHSLQSPPPPPRGTLCHLAEDGMKLFCRPPLPRRRFPASPVPICQRDKELLCRTDCTGKKKKGGGRIISAGFFFFCGFGFFYIFKSHWEPHYNLVISRGKKKKLNK